MCWRLKSRLSVGGVGEQMVVMKNPETRTEANRRCALTPARWGERGAAIQAISIVPDWSNTPNRSAEEE
jgi:hypothetical protein